MSFLSSHAEQIAAAAERIAGHVLVTPLVGLDGFVVKAESLQPTGSFKVRGAFNAVLSLPADARGVVTVSSGNHGQAVAYAAARAGLPAVVVMPATAAPGKLAAVHDLGARVICDGVTVANREERFRAAVAETGYQAIHPFDNWSVVHGQGTVGLEILAGLESVDTVVAPIGGGGLIAGIALAVKFARPATRIVGVEPTTADDARRSLHAGRVVSQPAGPTIADGVLAPAIGTRPAEVLLEHGLLDEVVTVSDDELLSQLWHIWRRTHVLVEPTGALAATAVLTGKVTPTTGTVAIASGGNVEPSLLARVIERRAPWR